MGRKKGYSLPTCQQCGFQWRWLSTLRKMFTFKPYMKCPNCAQEQYLSSKSRKRLIGLSILSLLIGSCLGALRIPFHFMVLYFLIIISVLPLFFEFSNEEEPLW